MFSNDYNPIFDKPEKTLEIDNTGWHHVEVEEEENGIPYSYDQVLERKIR